MRIGIPIPIKFYIPARFMECLLDLRDYEIQFERGALIEENRNELFLTGKDDDLLMIDSDIIFERKQVELVEKYLKDNDIITGIYKLSEGSEYDPALYKKVGLKYETDREEHEGMWDVDAAGCGFMGISKRVLNDSRMIRPFHRLAYNNSLLGEDISFCHAVGELGYKIKACDKLKVGHLREVVLI